MLVLVSFLCLLIFVYSLGYMHEEDGKPRYYAEVSLFATGMLGTVSADNFLQLLIFWEIMGLCSYLLIGFWYHKPEAAAAAKKAFLVTRVGDVAFLVGVLVIWNVFDTLSFVDIQRKMASLYPNQLTPQLLTLIPLLLFGGAVGKSAQFPLHTWLPDAMEGPTTVSALIHAATMVKAGVYLTARAFIFLVPLSPLVAPPFTAILVIAVIGGFTTIFAATMAVVNFDIKRVLAFSTISQLAYMFLGLGAGAYLMATDPSRDSAGYSAALYHLFNHAFFKALLFLGAGSVIHAVHTNDMREMGGLSNPMPVTSKAMLFRSLALAGIIPFGGFGVADAGFRQSRFLPFTSPRRGAPARRRADSGLPPRGRLDGRCGLGSRTRMGCLRDEAHPGGALHRLPGDGVLAPHADEAVLDRRRVRRVRPDRGIRGRTGPRLVRPQGHRRDRECGRPGRPRDRHRDGRVRPAGDRRRRQRGEFRDGADERAAPATPDGPGPELCVGRRAGDRGRRSLGVRDFLHPAVAGGSMTCPTF